MLLQLLYSPCYLAAVKRNEQFDRMDYVSDVKQYRQLLGETGDPEQSDMDELELQLAALVESQVGYVALLHILY
jgi:hypothetical protein